MNVIKQRNRLLKLKLEKESNDRNKLEVLKDYYKGMNAIIVGTGPNFQFDVNKIKNMIDENTILICLKQSIKCFDNISDFHLLNLDNIEDYNYSLPIKIMVHSSKKRHNADINFYTVNQLNENRSMDNWIDGIDKNQDLFTWNDKNLGGKNSTRVNFGKLMMELAIPLVINLGIKNVFVSGFVGGPTQFTHGIDITKGTIYKTNKVYERYLVKKKIEQYTNISKKLPYYFNNNYGVKIYSLNKNYYNIPIISYPQIDYLNKNK